MDEIVKFLDKFLLLPIFNEISLRSGFELIDNQIFNEGSISHQIFILYFVLIFGGIFLYFFSSGFSYYLFFIRWKDFYHPKTDPQPFPGQVALEIKVIKKFNFYLGFTKFWNKVCIVVRPLYGDVDGPFFLGRNQWLFEIVRFEIVGLRLELFFYFNRFFHFMVRYHNLLDPSGIARHSMVV